MKRYYFLLSLFFVAFGSQAQFQNIHAFNKTPVQEVSVGKMWGTYADSSTTYDWNLTKWDGKMHKVYSYDASNRISTVLEYDANTGAFEHKYTYAYNANDEAILLLMEANFGGTLAPLNRFITNYDGQGLRTSYKKETYVNSKWETVEGDSIAYKYDGQQHVTELVLNQLSGANVYPVQKLIWSNFNANDLPQTLVVQSFQNGFENYIKLDKISWRVGYKIIDFNPTSYLGSLWQNNDWQVVSYDTSDVKDGRIQTSYLFNVSGSTLDSSGKTEYLYDKTGRQMQSLSYQYQFGKWSASSGDQDSIIYGSFDEIQKRRISYYSQADKGWIPGSEERFYYNSLSIKNTANLELSVYPNPANSFVMIDIPESEFTLEVYDMKGRLFHPLLQGNSLETTLLPEGIYLLRVNTAVNTYSTRLVIQK